MHPRKGATPKATKPTFPFLRSSRTLRSPTSTSQSSPGKNLTANTTSGTADESMYPCDVCSITDKGDKVCCDGCNLWSHFVCVNVTSDISNHDWFCGKCKQQRQPLPIVTSSEPMATATNVERANESIVTNPNNTNLETHTVDVTNPSVTNSELGNIDGTNPSSPRPSQLVINGQGQIFKIPTKNDVIDPNPARSHKSKSLKTISLKSSTSSTSRKKALALQRLEEEQQLQRVRDKEERLRMEEDRKRRELKDKEYLDKKYSILEENSDDSLSYDGYDELMRQDQYDKVNRWRETVPPRTQTENPFVDLCTPDNWDDVATGQSKITPQMSSTTIFQPQMKVVQPMDEPIPILEEGNNSTINPIVNHTVNALNNQTVKPSYIIDVQSTQNNTITVPRGVQFVHSTSKFQTQPWSQAIVTSSSSQITSSVASNGYTPPVQTSSSQMTSSMASTSYTPPVGSNNQFGFASNNQHSSWYKPPLGVSSNYIPSNMVTSVTNNQTFSYTTKVATSMGNSAVQPTNQSHNTTFVVNGQSPWMTSSNNRCSNQTVTSRNQTSTSSQDPGVVLNQQTIMSSYPKSSLGYGQTSFVTSQPTVYQPYTPNPHQIGSMYQPVYRNEYLSSMNQQTIHSTPGVNTASAPHLSGNLSNATYNSSAPAANYQSFNSPVPMNASNYYAVAVPNQIIQNPGGVRQLTAEQIASRQVVPKDLPSFYGDPEDWIKFFSAYDNSTTICGYNNYENLGRLQKAIKGDAEEAVRSLLVHADAVPEVIRTLFFLFGRPELIIEKMINDVQKEPAPKDDDLASIMKFAIKVKNLSHSIRNTGVMEHLRNPSLINAITDKLPAQMQLNWAYHKQAVGYTDLATLGDWLSHIAEAASLVVRRGIKTSPKKKEQREKKENSSTNSTKPNTYVNTQVENTSTKSDTQSSDTKTKMCPACKNTSCFKLASCNKFKEMNRIEKASIIKDQKLCTRCLGGHHFFRCRSNLVCKIEGCKAKHHTLLHNHEKTTETQSKTNDNQRNETKDSSKKFSSNASHVNAAISNDRIDIFRIVPITIHNKHRSVHTYAYLDDGSNMTTMEAGLANELKLTGTSAPICVDWAFGYTHSVESKIVSERISGRFDEAEQYELDNVRTVKELHLPSQSISQSWIEQYKHLRALPIATYESIKPRMLIGLQYSRLTVSQDTVEGKENEPLACKTRLGWVVQGPSYTQTNQRSRTYSMNMCQCQSHDIKLHQLVKEYFSTENLGVKITDTVLESKEIQRARQIMEATTSKSDGRYEIGLLWKYDNVELPDSYQMALKRLRCLESKMSKDTNLADNLRNQIKQFVDKGYIRKLTPIELETKNDSPVWYLPTFPAFNPKKPEKVRIVWDGAAKVSKVSLNSVLLTGPDQLVPLPDILRRFRERLIAMLGDIKEMFHQIKVIKADQNAQRFLWRDNGSSSKPDVYVMMVVSFGLTCSPSQAQFIKNKNALEFVEEYPAAVNTIINNHYVDDMLDCEHTIDAAEQRIKEVKYIHINGGFEIRNFLSNSQELLRRIGESTDQPNRNMNINIELGTERVLGMFWNTATDCFTFSLKFTKITEKLLSGKQCPTKREVLPILMSMFDPLGLLAHYLIYTKILLQKIWRSNVDWDEAVTPPIFEKWVAWIKTLHSVENIQIPRLYSTKLSPNPPKSIQLHTFVDASAEAYATAIYFRIEDDDGVDCCLVGAKTKVAPNKPMSIPRLELQGAVLGTRLASSIKSSQTLKFDKQVFWTDSQTVMGWINSEARKYNQFVAFRIGEILEASNQIEWRWIPSEHNVADEATKSREIAKLYSSSRWYKAPKFLYEQEENWFKDEGGIEYFTEEEVRPSYSMACREIIRPQLIEIERFSQWNRLLRATAFIFRFIYNIRRKPQDHINGLLTQIELHDAENYLYRRAQLDCFADEIIVLQHNQKASIDQYKELDKSSVLRTSSPYLDEHGVIRMKGRTDAASALSFDTKRRIILPRRHRITKLIVDRYHRQYKHINHSTALNEIRQKYEIPALRVVLKGIRSSCQKCKNMDAEMAELPPARLAAYTLPFTYVGIDYFGPMRVRNGRKTRSRPVIMEKRWILLFTCLTTRAIWMEIAHSLDTNSCIMSVENFILRKGQPKEIHSDNGSSFHSSDKELSAEFEKMNHKEIEEKFTNSEMIWKFNPPATPHMGGVFERLVRTVKSCLKQTMLTRTPNDEMLKNLIVTAENIVNSRPLTYVSLESADDEALTPNHILLGSSNGRKPLGNVLDKDLARNTYKAVQVLANNFWHRFVLEYMPTLTKRTKWFKPVPPIKIGDVVVVVDERNERNTWPKGIVEELMPGKNGIVRQVMIRTAKGIRRRSVGKLAILDVKPPSTEVVKETPMVPLNGEGNVGQPSKLSTPICKK